MVDPKELTDKELMEELCDVEEGLSEWEVNFVDDVYNKMAAYDDTLSERQRLKAEQIFRKVMD